DGSCPFVDRANCSILSLHSFPTRRSSDLVGHRHFGGGQGSSHRVERIAQRPIGAAEGVGQLRAHQQTPVLDPLIAEPVLQRGTRSEEHTSELQSRFDLVCRLLLEKKKKES